MKNGNRIWQGGVLAAVCAVALPLFWFMFVCMKVKYSDPREDMSHGWLVPLACLFFIGVKRRRLAAAAGNPSWRGAVYVLLGLGLYWLGNSGEQHRVCQLAFSFLLWAVPYAIWGRGVARLMVFPASFFLFTIPFAFLDFFTIRLRMLAAGVATVLLNGVGLTVVRVGTALRSTMGEGFSLDVADPCSGLRSLFAMIALTTAYAYYTQRTLPGKWLLFLSAVPIAVIGNICRIASICVVAWLFGQDSAVGYYHDYSGYVVFLVGVVLMMQAGNLLDRLRLERFAKRPEPQKAETAEGVRPAGGLLRLAPALAVLAMFLSAWALKSRMGPPQIEALDFVATALPEHVGEFRGDCPWFCQNDQCLAVVMGATLENKGGGRETAARCPDCGGPLEKVAPGEKKLLSGDARMLKRIYRASDGLTYSVAVVVTGWSHSAIHRPELCLPSQGYAMEKTATLHLQAGGGKPLEVRTISLRSGHGARVTHVYWFSSRTLQTSSHSRRVAANVWDRSLHNRVSRWFMVSIQVSSPLDSEEAVKRLEGFLAEWYPHVYLAR